MENKDQSWLLRDTSNVIRGPYKHQEILSLLKKKQLKNKTEMSRANSYWFAVEEKVELARFFPELGLEAPPEEEKQTQMTATLTQADLNDREDITTFVSTPQQEARDPDAPELSTSSRAEWLSQEMADEFGDFEETVGGVEEPKPEARRANEISAEEMMKRATVKADTLPSEFKDFQGKRPKPINNIIRGPERAAVSSNVVQVPIDRSEAHAKIIPVETEEVSAARRKKILGGALFLLAAAGLAFAYALVARQPGAGKGPAKVAAAQKSAVAPEAALKRSLLLYDLEGAKVALADLELQPDMKGKYMMPTAQAILKKEFLFDVEGALNSLTLARSLANEGKGKSEVANLVALYSFDRDSEGSIDSLRGLSQTDPNEPIYKFNLGNALLRAGRTVEALSVISPLLASLPDSDPLYAETAFNQGWAQELDPKTRDAAEASFLRALGADPTFGKARLGLAIHRLRRMGYRASEADFRAFIDLAPDLDPPSRIINFRKMEAPEFYVASRKWIRELNLDGPMGSKPAPLVMAVDAMLSCLQNRTSEAGKILEGALSSSSSDFSVMKAMGYHRWKEGRYPEIVEIFREIPKDKMGFAVPYILGKALVRLDRRAQADKIFEGLTQALPNRSEGWALLGDSLARSGNKELARQKLAQSVRVDPRNLVAMKALEIIGQQSILSEESLGNLPF